MLSFSPWHFTGVQDQSSPIYPFTFIRPNFVLRAPLPPLLSTANDTKIPRVSQIKPSYFLSLQLFSFFFFLFLDFFSFSVLGPSWVGNSVLFSDVSHMPKIKQEMMCFAEQNAECSTSFHILICRLNILTLCILFCSMELHRFKKVESRGKLMKLGTKTWSWPQFWYRSGHQSGFAGFWHCCSKQRRLAEAILVLQIGGVGKVLLH